MAKKKTKTKKSSVTARAKKVRRVGKKKAKTKRPSPARRATKMRQMAKKKPKARQPSAARVSNIAGGAVSGAIVAGRAAATATAEKGGCSGGECYKFGEKRLGKQFWWCNSQGDNPCETPSTNCECHLIRSWEDPANPGTWKTEDLDRVTKKKAVEADGTSTYYCSCVAA